MFSVRRLQRPGRGVPRASLTWTEPLESRVLLSGGSLDTSFNGTGHATVDFGAGVYANAAAVGADGKTVIAGFQSNARHIAVARLNVDGTLDLSFGPDHSGKVVTPVDNSSSANAVAVQQDGKIVVTGYGEISNILGHPLFHMVVVRYNADGTLDNTFDGNGMRAVDFGILDHDSSANALVIQGDDKIVIAGHSRYGVGDGDEDFAVARLNPDGSTDGSFDDDGIRTIDFGDWEDVNDLAIDYSGTPATNPAYGDVVAVGTKYDLGNSYNDIAIARFNSDGSLDSGLDGDGKMLLRYGNQMTAPRGLVMQSGGRMVIGATVLDDLGMVRLLPTGQLDPSFGTGGSGWEHTDVGGIERTRDLIVGADDRLILGGISVQGVLGQSQTEKTYFVAYSPDGVKDLSWGVNGVASNPTGGLVDMTPGPGRRFVAVFGTAFHVARFLDTGANLVRVATINQTAYEQDRRTTAFVLYRTERLPYATRVYFDVGGTATAPSTIRPLNRDYTTDGMNFPDPFFDPDPTPYAEIPADQTFTTVVITPVDDTRVEGTETATFTIRRGDGYEVGSPRGVDIYIRDNDVGPPASVAGRYVFYNNSKYDGNDASAGASDDAAVAADKTVALPNQAFSSGNYSNYSRGINGIILDVANLPAGAGPAAADFAFNAGTDPNPANWAPVPGPSSVLVRRGAGAGGTDRVTLAWDNATPAVKNAWLRVTVRPDLATGLGNPDVFYFGNLVGETGNSATAAAVNAIDLGRVRAAQLTPAGITSAVDINRDGAVNAIDLGLVRGAQLRTLPLMGTTPPAALESPGRAKRMDDGGAAALLAEA